MPIRGSLMQFAGPGAELYAAVQQALQGTPYVVTPSDEGFDVAVDVPHMQVQSLLHRRQVRQVMRHRVKVDEPGHKLTINDESYRLEWHAGVAHVGTRMSKSSGRQIQVTYGRTVGADGSESGFHFNSEEGRRLITDTAKRLGWTIGMSTQTKIGLIAGLIGGVGGLAAAIAVLVVFVF